VNTIESITGINEEKPKDLIRKNERRLFFAGESLFCESKTKISGF
jgi:hypothetical protein